MAVKTILVCLTTESNARPLLQAATVLAGARGAYLIGLHTIEAMAIYPGIAVHAAGPAFEEFNRNQQQQTDAIKRVFDEYAAKPGVAAEWRSLRAGSTTTADRILESARSADLVLMAQEAPTQDRPDQRRIQQAVIRNSGRPVLIIPHGMMVQTLGLRMMIGWSSTRESARAAHDAIALAGDGASAGILVANGRAAPEGHELDTARELAAALSRHGLEIDVVPLSTGSRSIAESLQDEALARGADMIVTGAFGHSMIYDFVIGAVTSELLSSMKLPVLFSN